MIEFDVKHQMIRVTVHGELTDAGASELYRSVGQFLTSHDVRGGILDLSPVTSLRVALQTVRSLAKNPPLFQGPVVRVIVAPGALIFGMSRLFQITRSEIHGDLYVVRTLDEAYRRLNLETANFEVVQS